MLWPVVVLTKCTNGNNVKNIEVQLNKQMQEGNYDLEGSCDVEKSIGKPKFVLYLTDLIVHGTGIGPIEMATEKRNSYSFYYIFILRILLVDILVLSEFSFPYSVMQQPLQ